MRKPDLAAAIADKADLSKDQANRVLNAVLDEITKALSEKDSVTLVGFGTFLQRHRGGGQEITGAVLPHSEVWAAVFGVDSRETPG